MRCSNCGREIAPFEARLDSRDVLDLKNPRRLGWGRRFAFFYLCSECAASRDAVRRTILRALGTVVLGIFAIGALALVIQAFRK
jgi:hypothetical protein